MHLLELLMYLDYYPKKKDDSVLSDNVDDVYQTLETEDNGIPLSAKYTVTSTVMIVSTGEQLLAPFSICLGRKILQEFPDFYIGDTKHGVVFKLTDIQI